MPTPIRSFDGHNDTLRRLLRSTSDDPIGEFLAGGPKGHIDLPKAESGHFVGGLFALYSPSTTAPTNFSNMTGDSYVWRCATIDVGRGPAPNLRYDCNVEAPHPGLDLHFIRRN